jgi:alkylation response protein AidB-like acyl-CoA dehydrogenase
MMQFVPATNDQKFVLQHIAEISALTESETFADATPDMVDAILEGIGQLAAGEWAPLNRLGDTEGATLTENGVTMPEGFAAAYSAYVEGGWGTIAAPKEFGGQGLPFALAMAILESLGSANMAATLCPMLSVGAIESLAHHGSEELQAAYLPKLSSGEWTGTMNLTEPQAGSDVGALKTKAEPAGDGSWRISGQKIFITFGEHDLADNIIHLVLARTPGAPEGTKGISLFLVPRFRLDENGNPGEPNDVRCVSVEHKLGINASPTCIMAFGEKADCHGWLIGPEHAGMRAMFTMMNNARLNVGSQGVQIGERATQQAVNFARERVQSARAGAASRDPVAIIEHPDVRRMLMRMKSLTMAARALVYCAAGQVDRATLGDEDAKSRAELLTPLAKAYGTDVGCEVASLGIQVHGGMGFIEETGAAQHYRDARIAPIYEGTNGIQAADLVGRKLRLNGGEAMRSLLDDIAIEAVNEPDLAQLLAGCEAVVQWLSSGDASVDDQLAASYPFLTMLSVATCGSLMARQFGIAQAALAAGEGDSEFLNMKTAACRFYLDQIVPEAGGLVRAATATSDILYAVNEEALAS